MNNYPSSRFLYGGWCLVQFGDAVDSQLEGRSGLEVGLVVVAVEDCLVGIGHEVAVGIGCKSRGNGFAANGELAGVEDMQAAVFQSSLDLSVTKKVRVFIMRRKTARSR